MKELSLHLLDIVHNSIRGGAGKIDVKIVEKIDENILNIHIVDDGRGIPEDILVNIKSPFTTSRTLRNVGLGIPLFTSTCEACNGDLSIESVMDVGTKVFATMEYDHIDRPPLGDLGMTFLGLFVSYENIHFNYEHHYNNKNFIVDTKQLKEILGDVPMSNPQVYQWLKSFIMENIQEIKEVSDKNLTDNHRNLTT